MQVLRDAGDLAKGDQKGRKGGTKGEFESYSKVICVIQQNCMQVVFVSQLFPKILFFPLKLHLKEHNIFAGPSNVFKIVKMIMERNFQPVIIFSFSKKDCEAYALQMTKLDFNTGTDKLNIFFSQL